MKISLKFQWVKSDHYIGGFFGLSIKHLLFGGTKPWPKILSGFAFKMNDVIEKFSLVIRGNPCQYILIMLGTNLE
ncbi:MAG TPA: hypothetical protein DD706_23685 [Nitrospiraceae bacterium]|nr:hypothetical protein [Nitrospiraceae bacterium]